MYWGPLGPTGGIPLFYPQRYSGTLLQDIVSDPLKSQLQVNSLLQLEIYFDENLRPQVNTPPNFLLPPHWSPQL